MKRLLLLCLLIVVACTPPADVAEEPMDDMVMDESEDEMMEDVEVTTIVKKEPESIKALRDELKPSDKTRVYPVSKKLSVGDDFTFAYGATNNVNNPIQLHYIVSFKEAKDRTSNTIFADTTILDWIQTPLRHTFEVDGASNVVLPLEVRVGAMVGEDIPTQKGVYVFNVKTYYAETVATDDPDVYWQNDFTINVQ